MGARHWADVVRESTDEDDEQFERNRKRPDATTHYGVSCSCRRISSMRCSGLSALIVATGCPLGRAHQTMPLGIRMRTVHRSQLGCLGRRWQFGRLSVRRAYMSSSAQFPRLISQGTHHRWGCAPTPSVRQHRPAQVARTPRGSLEASLCGLIILSTSCRNWLGSLLSAWALSVATATVGMMTVGSLRRSRSPRHVLARGSRLLDALGCQR